MSAAQPHTQTSALLVIDMQDDFVLPGAPAELPDPAEVVPNPSSPEDSIYRRLRCIVSLHAFNGSIGRGIHEL